MATIRQKKAVDIIVENGGNVSGAMREAGYTKETAKTPSKLTNSIGFKEICDERGLTDNLILDALVADIDAKEGNRHQELALGAKIRGMLVDKKEITGKDGKDLIPDAEKKQSITDKLKNIL